MDVWFKWARKDADCEWCGKVIHRKTAMVVTKLWRKGDADKRKWNIIHYYHPECYIAQGLHYLADNPFTEVEPGKKKGRPEIQLCEEDKKTRIALLKKKSNLEGRIRAIKAKKKKDAIVKEAELTVQLAEVMQEIERVGGAPAVWKEEHGRS
jgi:hypothetical protein